MTVKSKGAVLVRRSGNFSPNDCVVSRREERRLLGVDVCCDADADAREADVFEGVAVVIGAAVEADAVAAGDVLAAVAPAETFLSSFGFAAAASFVLFPSGVVPRKAAKILSASLSVSAPPNPRPFSRFESRSSASESNASVRALCVSPSSPVSEGDLDRTTLSFFLAPSRLSGDPSVSGRGLEEVASASVAWISAKDCDTLSEPVSATVG